MTHCHNTGCDYPAGGCAGACQASTSSTPTRRVRAGQPPATPPAYIKATPQACSPALCQHDAACPDHYCPGHPLNAGAPADQTGERAMFALVGLVVCVVLAGVAKLVSGT